MRKKVLFIASYPKSGNTWVRYFLGSYVSGKSSRELAKLSFSPIAESTSLFERVYKRKFRKETFFEKFDDYLQRVAHYSTLLKTHMPCYHINSVPIFPKDSSYIYLFRSPFTLLPSFSNHMNIPLSLAVDGVMRKGGELEFYRKNKEQYDDYKYNIGTWFSHINSWASADRRVLFVSFEALSRNPKSVFTEIVRFSGLEFNKDRFDFALHESSAPRMTALENEGTFRESSKKGTRFFNGGSIDPDMSLYSEVDTKSISNAIFESRILLKEKVKPYRIIA